jgi:hypothetical protein
MRAQLRRPTLPVKSVHTDRRNGDNNAGTGTTMMQRSSGFLSLSLSWKIEEVIPLLLASGKTLEYSC